jgi:hypothetical protein
MAGFVAVRRLVWGDPAAGEVDACACVSTLVRAAMSGVGVWAALTDGMAVVLKIKVGLGVAVVVLLAWTWLVGSHTACWVLAALLPQ